MFAESLCLHKASIIEEAITIGGVTPFTDKLQASLTNILSCYRCRVSPTPTNLKLELWNIAKYELQVKPMAAVYVTKSFSGIPFLLNLKQFYIAYLSLNATPAKVLSIIDKPFLENTSQACALEYLQQYIGDMKNDNIRRFTTDSTVIIDKSLLQCFSWVVLKTYCTYL